MTRYNRIMYDFKMQYNGQTLEINNFDKTKAFFTLEYDVENNASDKIQQSKFTIYNLPEKVIAYFAKSQEETKDVDVVFSVGNSDDGAPSQIFTGKATTIQTTGLITLATEINAFPVADTRIYQQINLKKGATINDLKTAFATKLKLTLDNQAGDDNEKLTSDFNTITQDVLTLAKKKFPNQLVMIDEGKLIFMSKTQQLQPATNLFVFTESNGLLEGPTTSGLLKEVKTFLRPNIRLNDSVVVAKKRIVGQNYNGTYIVSGIKHCGKVSCVSASLNYSVFQLRNF